MVHANAVLTPRGRLLLARRVVDEGWPIVRAAEHFHVSWPTAKRWASRYAAMGPAGMTDRSSRPYHSPHRTPGLVVRRIVELRWRHRLSPLAIASRLSIPASTVHAVLVRCRLNRLSHIDIRHWRADPPLRARLSRRADPRRRQEVRQHPRWRGLAVRRTHPGLQEPARHRGSQTQPCYDPKLGHAFVHTVIDDHSRVAYAEIHDDETAVTAIAVLHRAVGWFQARGVTVERVLSDNGSCYKSHAWRDACAELRITHKRTRPYRPQTNGKIERFHRTMATEWAYARHYGNERARRASPTEPGCIPTITTGNTARSARPPPIRRLTNLPGQYS